MADSSRQSRPESGSFSPWPEADGISAHCRSRSTPLARMAAISHRRWSGVRLAGSSSIWRIAGSLWLCPQRPSLGDQHAVRRDSIGLYYLFTPWKFEVSVGSESNLVVNPERVVQQRVREFAAGFSMIGSNHPRYRPACGFASAKQRAPRFQANARKPLTTTGYENARPFP